MQLRLTVWLKRSALEKAIEVSARAFPMEAGGLLLGYRASATEYVVEQISGPGPDAKHSPRSFIPDYEHDEKHVQEIYDLSNGETIYLGDWHSHPNTSTSYLSSKDRGALRNILKSESAQLDAAISIILAGSTKSNWTHRAWVAELVQTFMVFHRVAAVPAIVKLYD